MQSNSALSKTDLDELWFTELKSNGSERQCRLYSTLRKSRGITLKHPPQTQNGSISLALIVLNRIIYCDVILHANPKWI